MKPIRATTAAVFGLHVAYGAVMLAAPERMAPWLGSPTGEPPTQVPLRGIGGREVAMHGVALSAALRGASLRPWLLASLAGDLTDLLATVSGRRGLPEGALKATLATGGGSALLSAALLALADRGP